MKPKKEETLLTVLKKKYFKLMINFVYGNTMKNLRNKISVRVMNNEKDFLKHSSKRTFVSTKIFDGNNATIHEIKPVLTLNKRVYVGFTVLELSKWLVCDFHYNFMKTNCDAELLFTDTDSKSKDVYQEFFKHKHLFDLSNYPKDSNCFDPTNNKVIGKMKDVSERKINDDFVGLKPKMRSVKNIDGKESNTAKGVNIATEFNEFKDTLYYKKEGRHKVKRIQRILIFIKTIKSSKVYYKIITDDHK